jgi:hypothetical protein
VAHVVEEMKRNSSRWIKALSPRYEHFAWQGGYAAFSVSQSVVEKTRQLLPQGDALGWSLLPQGAAPG